MSDAQHTPGEWELFDKGETLSVHPKGDHGSLSPIVHWLGFDDVGAKSHEENRANATLIARAPELLTENARLTAQRDALAEAAEGLLNEPIPSGPHQGMRGTVGVMHTDPRAIAVCTALATMEKTDDRN